MAKAKQFIQNYKRACSNVNVGWNDNGEEITWCSPWLSPDDAIRAVEIEREETIDKACEFFENHLCCYIKAQDFTIEHSRLEQDFKKYMEE